MNDTNYKDEYMKQKGGADRLEKQNRQLKDEIKKLNDDIVRYQTTVQEKDAKIYEVGEENLKLQKKIEELKELFLQFKNKEHELLTRETDVTKRELAIRTEIAETKASMHAKSVKDLFELVTLVMRNPRYVKSESHLINKPDGEKGMQQFTDYVTTTEQAE